MRIRLLTTTGILFLFLLFTACQNQDSSESRKSAEPEAQIFDSNGLKSFVDKYMDAMLEKNPSETLFTKDRIFTENGVRLPLGDEGLWASMVGKGTYKFYVPDVETQQIGFFGTAREEPQNEGADPTPVSIALRLKIENGLISEAEQLVVRPENNLLNPEITPEPSSAEKIEKMGKELGTPNSVFTEVLPENERPSREEMIKTANYYFSGMQKNDGKGVDGTGTYPFTDDCDRYENGGRSTNVPLAQER